MLQSIFAPETVLKLLLHILQSILTTPGSGITRRMSRLRERFPVLPTGLCLSLSQVACSLCSYVLLFSACVVGIEIGAVKALSSDARGFFSRVLYSTASEYTLNMKNELLHE